jgi:hypothetical protein
MKLQFITIMTLAIFNFSFSQEMVKMKIKSGTKDQDLREILDFEDICMDKIEFTSKEIVGKNYEINIIEYKEGKLVSTTKLFESSEIDLFRIKDAKFKFTLLSKFIDKTKLKIALKFDRYGSKTLFYDLIDTKFGYTMKNFLGSKSEIEIPLNKEFYITSIISPTMHEDGSASYCEVVKVVNPEKIGEEFKIPHYFLVQMKFKR